MREYRIQAAPSSRKNRVGAHVWVDSGGRRLGPTEIVMHAELKREGLAYAARAPYTEIARQRDKQAQEVPVES